MIRIAIAIAICAPVVAWAQPEPESGSASASASDPESGSGSGSGSDSADVAPTPAELAQRLEDLEQQLHRVQSEQRKAAATREQVQTLLPLRRFITVFVDVGAFAVGGDGSGIRSDIDHLYFPGYAGRIAGQWVFMGDPLSTTINSLGEPADTSDSREIKTDTLKAGDHASMIVNSVGLSIGKDVGHGISLASLVELLPRPGNNILDIELAHIDYRPSEEVNLVLSAGKIDSVLGVEYRSQDALRRLGVTPSLICRYTCGRPVGVEARLVRGALSTSASLTNGDNFDQRFEPELALHPNALPTAAGHVQWMLPVGQGLEVGVSGAIGPQDNQPQRSLEQWHYGFDLRLTDLERFDVTAEYVQGKQPGKTMTVPCDLANCLTYKGAYLLVDRRVTPWVTPYVRIDWRSAVHQSGVEFVYESHTVRATVGAHFELTRKIIAKLEYTYNRELGNIPQFPDDVLTTSVVVSTE